MTEPRKRTAAETWRALEEMTEDAEEEAKIDAEMERVLALTPDQVERELADDGFDLQAIRARGEAIARQATALEAASTASAPAPALAPPPALTPSQAPAAVIPIAPRRSLVRTVMLVAASFAFATVLVMVGLIIWQESHPENAASPPPTPKRMPAPDPQPQPPP